VWPLSRPKAEEVLRIGRHAVERWKAVDGSLAQVSAHALPQDAPPHPQRLAEAVSTLYASAPALPITLVLESAWVPVMLVDTGAALLRSAQVDALVRHRFGLHHSDSLDPVTAWDLRIEYRAGSRCALAYGMPPGLKQTLIDAGRAAGLEWAAMTPALAWGMERLRIAKRWPRTSAWFLWPEQDRTLVARVASNEVVGFNPGAASAGDETTLKRLVDAECARLGIESTTDPIAAARWYAALRAARAGDRFAWLDLSEQGSPLATPAKPTPPARVSA